MKLFYYVDKISTYVRNHSPLQNFDREIDSLKIEWTWNGRGQRKNFRERKRKILACQWENESEKRNP